MISSPFAGCVTLAAAACVLSTIGCQHPDASLPASSRPAESETTVTTPEPRVATNEIERANPDVVPASASEAVVRSATEQSGSDQSLLVLELFTSEGCSSCPPADRNLKTIQAGREQFDGELIVLSWHVDYWNHLGWKDPFSFREASQRQRRYAARLKTGVFTPQLIVNGIQSAVGSRSVEVTSAVSTGRLVPSATVSASSELIGTRSCRVVVDYDDAPTGGVILVGLVQKSALVKVSVGENGGRTLEHVNIVRDFHQEDAKSTNDRVSVELELPDGLTPDAVDTFVLLQAGETGRVLAAELVPLQPRL